MGGHDEEAYGLLTTPCGLSCPPDDVLVPMAANRDGAACSYQS